MEANTTARVVGGAALDSLMKVFGAIETAGWHMVGGVSDATTDLIEHRYGKDAGKVSKDTAAAIGGGVTAIRSGLSVLPTSLALSAVQQAAKNDSIAQAAYDVVAEDFRPRRRSSSGIVRTSRSNSEHSQRSASSIGSLKKSLSRRSSKDPGSETFE